MISRRSVVSFAILALAAAGISSPAAAQTPGVIYSWDHAYGETTGDNIEGWAFAFGTNSLGLGNATDGILSISEVGTAGTDWAITDSWNRIRESLNPADYGGLDLTGLSSLELDLAHSSPNTMYGQVFAQVGPSSDWKGLGQLAVAPGGLQTYSVPLSGLSQTEINAIRTLGVQIYGHESEGNLNWQLSEIRSVGTPLTVRRVADYPVGAPAPAPAAPFEGAIFNFDADNVQGHTVGAQDNSGMGYNTVDGALTWTEVATNGSAPGAAVTWGSGNGVGVFAATEFSARPVDLSNYTHAKIRIRVQSTVANEEVGVQFYTQGAGFAYHNAGDLSFTAGTQYHELLFPLAGVPDLDQTQFHGINLGAHAGTWGVRIDYVEYVNIPEPASFVLLGLAGLGMLGLVRRR